MKQAIVLIAMMAAATVAVAQSSSSSSSGKRTGQQSSPDTCGTCGTGKHVSNSDRTTTQENNHGTMGGRNAKARR